ncbi:glycosyltransferase family protein [Thermanaerothrix sp. 4228-RoL]|jgi:spore coat polysaccharide biosynthesis protein SpsF|uniref:Glycosyltransferase family protein n=1 Tax=Thermanaerothrix solaris TaxID=3058434 RepID=A0ABU3NQH2_9CHLR|nr:glycosyltransferase family protein [Thermanaerothrix sp. 4228-RoL]MDT8899083.1 glycosyltransferase family protein [Thermanaerothrix sp. 4228-RoL]
MLGSNPNIVAILQARMSSSRLPGKVLLDLAGRPVLAWGVERARRSRFVDRVIVATTTEAADDPIVAFCQARGYPWWRGHPYDVLDRFYQAARHFQADIIVRLTADCPLIDPELIDATVEALLQQGADFAANRLPPPWRRTYPIGLDVEVCTFNALERAWREATAPHQREHVMPYLYEVEGRFHTVILNAEADYGQVRWTVDTPQDLEVVRKLVALLGERDDFNWREALAVWQAHPELAALNAQIPHHTYTDVDERFGGGDIPELGASA